MEYYSLNRYLQDTFHEKVYKVAVNAGFTCPTRDGSKGTGGCIFCSAKGSGEFAADPSLSVTEQIEEGKLRILPKSPQGVKLIAYFQAFTNTYAPVERLRELYTQAVSHPDVVAVSVATRPDCLPEEVLDLLSELNEIKPVWVELGLQTVHEKTAGYIRRGYPLSVFDDALRRLKARNLITVVHVILGLPGESEEEMLQTVDYVGKSGADGIKIQLLYVLKDTDLAKDYAEGRFKCLSMEEYVSLVVKCLKILPPRMVIHRLTGDGDKKILIAPGWSADKKKVLNALTRAIKEA